MSRTNHRNATRHGKFNAAVEDVAFWRADQKMYKSKLVEYPNSAPLAKFAKESARRLREAESNLHRLDKQLNRSA